MADQQHNGAAVRVCAIADIECSRGCGTGACKREQPAAAPNRDAELGAFVRRSIAALADSPKSFLANVQRAIEDQDKADTSAPAPVDERAAFALAMVEAGYHEPEPSPFSEDAFKYQRDQDRYIGFQLGRQSRACSANETGADERAAWRDAMMSLCTEWCHNPKEAADHLRAQRAADRESVIAEILRKLDGMIKKGPLDEPAHSERNGIVLAFNAVAQLSVEQPAEPVAQWQYRIRTPGYDGDWHNCNPETAKRLQEQPYAEDHDVRALYAAPQPPAQADAREGLTDAQREAIEYAARWLEENVSNRYAYTATKQLRALLKGADHAE
ncbi:hypothetical protein [Burkholderia multivorans]|uniref:hypothetical protein n=1 Tax=Burkholderia multivorans TaxID=87883 RepID=UPI0009E0C852|nr:hypothetical protein [Burkholderia multivorans]SAJ89182.1 gp38 [Burkholderia multivorans]